MSEFECCGSIFFQSLHERPDIRDDNFKYKLEWDTFFFRQVHGVRNDINNAVPDVKRDRDIREGIIRLRKRMDKALSK